MGDKSKIEWTDATWNPVAGCTKVSHGCDNCYAIRQGARLQHLDAYAGTVEDGDWTGKIVCNEGALAKPLHWKRPRRIFVNSMSDLFHPLVPIGFIYRVWAIMQACPQHTFQILTKRPQAAQKILHGTARFTTPEFGLTGLDFDKPLPNVWLGTSIESEQFEFRARILKDIPAAVRFISAEPLLGPLPTLPLDNIDWLIVGGESGKGARPMHPDWVRDLRERARYTPRRCPADTDGDGDCASCYRDPMAHGHVPFFFKQWGEWGPTDQFDTIGFDDNEMDDNGITMWPNGNIRFSGNRGNAMDDSATLWRVGRKMAGALLDDRAWLETP